MSNKVPIPSAQYLWMSTEDQQYSIANQRIRIQEYAQDHSFNVMKTYEEPAESGNYQTPEGPQRFSADWTLANKCPAIVLKALKKEPVTAAIPVVVPQMAPRFLSGWSKRAIMRIVLARVAIDFYPTRNTEVDV